MYSQKSTKRAAAQAADVRVALKYSLTSLPSDRIKRITRLTPRLAQVEEDKSNRFTVFYRSRFGFSHDVPNFMRA